MPDDDKYGPMLHWPRKASKFGFLSSFNFNKQFLIDRVPSWNLGLWPDWGVGHRCSWPWYYNSLFFSHKDHSNEPSQVQFNPKELKLYLKNRNFHGKGPSQGQIPGLLGHGSKIPLVILWDIYHDIRHMILTIARLICQTFLRTNDAPWYAAFAYGANLKR
jgi:hypothetical protein